MAGRSLNKVLLIGNLTRDPELRYTPQGTAVCTFGLATNRQWTTDEGEKKEEVEFHNVVAWARLAEVIAEYLKKGRPAFVEGRLSTREWEAQDGTRRRTTEIVANEVIFLGSPGARGSDDLDVPADFGTGAAVSEKGAPEVDEATEAPESDREKEKPVNKAAGAKTKAEDEDMPF